MALSCLHNCTKSSSVSISQNTIFPPPLFYPAYQSIPFQIFYLSPSNKRPFTPSLPIFIFSFRTTTGPPTSKTFKTFSPNTTYPAYAALLLAPHAGHVTKKPGPCMFFTIQVVRAVRCDAMQVRVRSDIFSLFGKRPRPGKLMSSKLLPILYQL